MFSLIVLGLATDVRLAPGIEADLKPYEGIVEVEVNGTWGPIARHAIDDITVKTICRMLGYGYVQFIISFEIINPSSSTDKAKMKME